MKKYTARLTLLVVTLSLVLSLGGRGAYAGGYAVVVDGTTLAGAQAEIRSGQLMVALRPYIDAFGGSVAWDPRDWRATVFFDGSQVAFWVGTSTVYHDGQRISAPVAPYIKADKAMVPAWWLAVRLGAKVSFDGATLKVETGDFNRGASPRPSPGLNHPLMKSSYVFPFPTSARYEPYYDGWGDPRSYGGKNFGHEGTDILAKTGTPIVAVASGTVVRYGWNTLGGYRVTVRLDDYPEYTFYYAHMDRYAPGIYQGARVRAGQLLGYVGSTGEGPERTQGKFVPHLHFGIYGRDGAINPYKFLKYWEGHKASL